MTGIEFICWGNNARSVMAEVIAKEYVERIDKDIPIFSSGLAVDRLRETGITMLEAADVAEVLGIDFVDPVDYADKLRIREAGLRDRVLKMRNYTPPENHKPQQTQCSNANLILTAAAKYKNILSTIYSTPPNAHTVAEYSGVEISQYSWQAWFSNTEAMLIYLDCLIEAVPKAIDKYIVEFSVV